MQSKYPPIIWLALCIGSVLLGIFDIVHSAETLRCVQLGWLAGITTVLWMGAWLILAGGLFFFFGPRPPREAEQKSTKYHVWTAYFCISGFVLAMIILYAFSMIKEEWDRFNLPRVQSSVLQEITKQFPSTTSDTFSELQPQCIPKSLGSLDFEGKVLLLPGQSKRTPPKLKFDTWERECRPYIRITLSEAHALELKGKNFQVTSLIEWHERKCGYPPSSFVVAMKDHNPIAIIINRRIEYPEFDEFRQAYICQLEPELRNHAYIALNRQEPSQQLCSPSPE